MKLLRTAATLLALVSLAAAAPARAWNAAAHAWVVQEQHRQVGRVDPADPNRIYGAAAPDLFQAEFTTPWVELQAVLHDPASTALLQAWQAAGTPAQRAFAFGMLTHSNGFGADATAHVRARLGHGEGYVIEKARLLAPALAPLLAQAGLVLPDEVLLLVCHILVEQAVDLQLAAWEPAIPASLFAAAAARAGSVPDLLVEAWAGPFTSTGLFASEAEAAAFIVEAEARFRWDVAAYAWALTQPDAMALMVAGIGLQAEAYLGLPPGTGTALAPLIEYGIRRAEALTARDWWWELRATASYSNAELARRHIAPAPWKR